MQFEKKTRIGNTRGVIKILIKIILVLVILFVAVVLIDRINFPSPIKKIEKIISNENFKIVK
jgi:preprotein translocase subunit SecG|tara:strand:- start:72 stop:257 length:186 start_codon:yes stop_codon:yes gene_type:complete